MKPHKRAWQTSATAAVTLTAWKCGQLFRACFRRRCRRLRTDTEGFEAMVASGLSEAAATGGDKAVAHSRMHGDEALQPAGRAVTAHHLFPRSERQVAVFGTIVEPLVRPVLEPGSDLTLRRCVRCQLGTLRSRLVGASTPSTARGGPSHKRPRMPASRTARTC